MYSTKLSDNRYYLRCITIIQGVDIVECIVDTGALYTAFTAEGLVNILTEQQLIDEDCEVKYLGGFVEESFVKFYKVVVNQFTIGSIDMGCQEIWVTYSEDVTLNVLGMDILKQVTIVLLRLLKLLLSNLI